MVSVLGFFSHRIGIIEKKLEDVMYETRGWEEKNKKLTDRVSNQTLVYDSLTT